MTKNIFVPANRGLTTYGSTRKEGSYIALDESRRSFMRACSKRIMIGLTDF